MGFLLAFLTVLQLGPDSQEVGQSKNIGIVWSAPESSILAVSELDQIKSAGFRFIRTGPVTDQAILERADSLDLILYRELPIVRYASDQLVDSTAYAAAILRDLIYAGRDHSSAGPIGLAVKSDVSDSHACSYFSDVRQGVTPVSTQQFYYVGSFIDDDACNQEVDFVLLDVLDRPSPVSDAERWGASHARPVGLASVGRWVATGDTRGLGASNSLEEQARYLEDMIRELESYGDHLMMFVHRWKDQTLESPSGAYDVTTDRDLYNRQYGINDSDRNPRPAAGVLRAYLTQGQNVFAFEPVRATHFSFPWFVLLGWALIITVAVLYASSPRFRYMLPRYFMAHGFFRNAVREAREVLPIVSTALLTITGVAIGMVGTQVLLSTHETETFKYLVSIQSSQFQSVLNAMLTIPFLSVILIGSIALLAISIWMGIWMIIASRNAPLLPSQALMLGVWPRWPLLLLLPMAMSIHSLPPDEALVWIALLVPLWIGTAIWASVRTTYDLYKITNCGLLPAVAVWLVNPAWLSIVAALVVAVVYSSETSFVWHLLLRS